MEREPCRRTQDEIEGLAAKKIAKRLESFEECRKVGGRSIMQEGSRAHRNVGRLESLEENMKVLGHTRMQKESMECWNVLGLV